MPLSAIQKEAARIRAAFLSKRPQWTPHTPTERQRLFLNLDCLEAFYGGAAGGGKQIPLDVLLPTPRGYRRNAELSVGSRLFDEKGNVCSVVRLYSVSTPAVSYRLTFDDGSQLDACSEHRWLTFTAADLAALTRRDPEWRARRRAKRESRAAGVKSKAFTDAITARNMAHPPAALPVPTGGVRTTEEIYQTLYTDSGRTNHAIPVTGALNLLNADLIIDPYTLGLWLGDGYSRTGYIGMASEDWDAIHIPYQRTWESLRRPDNKITFTPFLTCSYNDLNSRLRQAGLLSNKHVPAEYMRASKEQRLALVQGLMDTDGTVCESGSVEFTNTNKRIVDGLYELIVSLGWKARVVESRAKLNGKDCGSKWDIKWTPSDYVFRLPRKRDKQKLATRRTTKFRYIVDCRRVESVPMRCVEVDSPSHLFLIGRSMIPTHNSDALLMAALQYVDQPKYAAILFRRTYTDLALPDALMAKSQEWLKGTKARWSDKDKTWTFPSRSTVTFGYLESENDKYRYQSSQFQFIGFDEASQFTEGQYTYLFSRLRKLAASTVPLRMRAASNPGGVGATWVYDRFIPEHFTPEQAREVKIWTKEGANDEGTPTSRVFVPSTLNDNPHLDRAGYERSLANLDPVTRAQLLRGDWLIKERGNILPMWDERVHVIKRSEFESIFGCPNIPETWLCSVYQDWGSTSEHPCVTTWFATVPQNGPIVNGVKMAGQVFAYRTIMTWDSTVREVATVIDAMMSGSEKSRTQRWQMSHEAASERAAYRREHGLPFQAWQTGKTRGIAQLGNALELIEVDKPHPFRPEIMGHPSLYLLVDDDQFIYPKTDRGFARHRAEFPAYKWATLKSGEPLTNLIPHALFNDAIDTVRAAAADYWPSALALTRQEKLEKLMPPELRLDSVLQPSLSLMGRKTMTPGSQMAYYLALAEAKRKMKPRRLNYGGDD